MLPAFKKGHNANLSKEWRYFNTKLAKILIKSEHCIDLIKAWFQHLPGVLEGDPRQAGPRRHPQVGHVCLYPT